MKRRQLVADGNCDVGRVPVPLAAVILTGPLRGSSMQWLDMWVHRELILEMNE